MKKTIYLNDFMEAFVSYGRDYYSYEGYEMMFEIMEEYDPNWELDVIALCGEFSEYDSIEECCEDCGCDSLEELQDNHCIYELSNGHILITC